VLSVAADDMAMDYDLSWVNSGGGWISMSNGIGWANLFSQIGLISAVHCNFTSIGGLSGGSWFSTQFMYSQQFQSAALANDVKSRYDFIFEWIDSFLQYMESTPVGAAPGCSLLSPLRIIDGLDDVSLFCRVLHAVDGDYALLMSNMFRAASTNYGDPSFINRIFDNNSKLKAFQDTNHYVLTGVAANSRYVDTSTKISKVRRDKDMFLYLSPSSGTNLGRAVTLPVPYLYVVEAGAQAKDPFFDIGIESESLPLKIKVFKTPPHGRMNRKRFRLSDWEAFGLSPGTNGSVYNSIKVLEQNPTVEVDLSNNPLDGKVPTVIQVISASSAALSAGSGLLPSTLAQYVSAVGNQSFATAFARSVYNADVLHKLSICSRWPEPCSSASTRFVDGGYVEGLGTFICKPNTC
jgi:hypothetical protein